jgi:ADP-heptose:LPS heptosyltransferase
LAKGDLWQGFGRFRSRFTSKGGLQRFDFAQPVWQGEDIRNKTILVFDEEGRGDGLMMARYLPLLKERGARVKFHAKPSFANLFRNWSGIDEMVVEGELLGQFDTYCWIMDLPYHFGTTLGTIPRAAYLPQLSPTAETNLSATAGKKKIGVVWAGSSQKINGLDKRAVPLRNFADLFDIAGYEFYNLTRDKREGDTEFMAHFPITDLAPQLRDFADLSRFVAQMDLIITVDTATAHLAGGMGKPVWNLLPFCPDWRWMLDRADSPWYPTMRLMRQQKPGDWIAVIDQIKNDLQDEGIAPEVRKTA